METHKKELQTLNSDYEHRLKVAYEQRDKLVEEYERTKLDYKKKLDSILEENKDAFARIEAKYKGGLFYLQPSPLLLSTSV